MADLQDALSEGDIHLRDKTQFELTTEYIPSKPSETSNYTLKFYFFIPALLQITPETYSKQQFYADETNFIRLKTPTIALKSLVEPLSNQHPLFRAQQILKHASIRENSDTSETVEELKLYANMVRSAIRMESHRVWTLLHSASEERQLRKALEDLQTLCLDIQTLRTNFFKWTISLTPLLQEEHLEEYIRYIDEFISTLCEHYEASLLQALEQVDQSPSFPSNLSPLLLEVKQQLTACMAKESQHRIENQERSVFADDPEKASEYMLYRKGILKRFVSEALVLSMTRTEPRKTFLEFVTPLIAGLLMFCYLYFLSFHSIHPMFDSGAFIIITAFLYVMRDRMKEQFKQMASRLSSRWFPDYQTTIRTPSGNLTLGTISEWVNFCEDSKIPETIKRLRKQNFHGELNQAKRAETVLCFSKKICLFPKIEQGECRSHAFVDIFRYNISSFLIKAGDPYKEELIFNPLSQKVEYIKSPKVYHIPIILEYNFVNAEGAPETVHKCYRIILDKKGIKRIEKI